VRESERRDRELKKEAHFLIPDIPLFGMLVL